MPQNKLVKRVELNPEHLRQADGNGGGGEHADDNRKKACQRGLHLSE